MAWVVERVGWPPVGPELPGVRHSSWVQTPPSHGPATLHRVLATDRS